MKNKYRLSGIIFILIFSLSCSKKEKPVYPGLVVTTPVTEILYATATSGGEVTYDGGGPIFTRGVCFGKNSSPTADSSITVDGSGMGPFTSYLTGLKPGTLYHLRAYAKNSAGTVYGDEVTFITQIPEIKFNTSLTYGSVTDIDGRTYKTIPVGVQVWMAENLRTTKLNDGTVLPKIIEDADWSNLLTAAYCWFNNNDSLYGNIYGAYYNWYAVSSGKLCPDGWHVPSDVEWQQMVDYLGGNNVAGSKIKETGKNNWVLPNGDASNNSGLTGLPAGMRGSIDGSFSGQGYYGGWWTATQTNSSLLGSAWSRWVHGDTTVIARSEIFKKDGFGIRCIKN
jgi:uncharacterized protein (TIGR02145 family)